MPHPLLNEHADLSTSIEVLDKWIEHTMHKHHQPGIALGIIHNGELLWGKGYGYANVEAQTPVTLDTRFRIASITKTFTATGILQLRDAGKLSLDDPVSSHLDWFNLRYEGAPEITIRNLLTHSSGLSRDSHNPMWTECNAPVWDEFVQATKNRPPTRPPYDKFAYSNLGYSLLGGIIEALSGLSWADYLQQNILTPLGMTQTHPTPQSDDPLLAKGYSRFDEDYERSALPFFLMNGFEASANFASSINDLVKYARFHLALDTTPVLSAHTLRDMHRIHWLYDQWNGGYGLGIGTFKVNDWIISGHSGGYPGYLTGFTLCRAQNAGVILLTNALNSNPSQYIEQAYKLVLPQLIKTTQKDTPPADPLWQQYVGDYSSRWGLSKVVIRDHQLQIVPLESIDMPATVLEPTDQAHVFTLQEQGQSNETAHFELDDNGHVVKLWVRNEYSNRQP